MAVGIVVACGQHLHREISVVTSGLVQRKVVRVGRVDRASDSSADGFALWSTHVGSWRQGWCVRKETGDWEER